MGLSIKTLVLFVVFLSAQMCVHPLQAGGMIDFDDSHKSDLTPTQARDFLKALWVAPHGHSVIEDLNDDQQKNLALIREGLGEKLLKSDSLSLSQKGIFALPSLVVGLTHLKVLDLSQNRFCLFPKQICVLTNLVHLDLSHNEIEYLPDDIANLGALKNLDLENNRLTSLPESIGKLTSLEVVRLSFNNLESLPETLGQLSNLHMVVLTANNLKSIPKALGNILNLREIHLDFNEDLRMKTDGVRSLFLSHVFIYMDNSVQGLAGTKASQNLTQGCDSVAALTPYQSIFELPWIFSDFFSF